MVEVCGVDIAVVSSQGRIDDMIAKGESIHDGDCQAEIPKGKRFIPS
jgi:hypothetical protein